MAQAVHRSLQLFYKLFTQSLYVCCFSVELLHLSHWSQKTKGIMVTAVKILLVDNPLKIKQAVHEGLTRETALAVFSSDALSSKAYQQTIPVYPSGGGRYIVVNGNLGDTPVFRSENG
jgi:hypothetical protein